MVSSSRTCIISLFFSTKEMVELYAQGERDLQSKTSMLVPLKFTINLYVQTPTCSGGQPCDNGVPENRIP